VLISKKKSFTMDSGSKYKFAFDADGCGDDRPHQFAVKIQMHVLEDWEYILTVDGFRFHEHPGFGESREQVSPAEREWMRDEDKVKTRFGNKKKKITWTFALADDRAVWNTLVRFRLSLSLPPRSATHDKMRVSDPRPLLFLPSSLKTHRCWSTGW
jgi:hypothetical protein